LFVHAEDVGKHQFDGPAVVRLGFVDMIEDDPAEKSGLAPTFDNFVSSFLVGELGDAILLIYIYIYVWLNVRKRSVKTCSKWHS
jgi:hypothetical protein